MKRSTYFTILIKSMLGYCYRASSNPVKQLLGKAKYHSPQDKFIGLYIKHLLSFKLLPLEFKLTSSADPKEGAASQALLSMFAMNFSKFSGLPYVHSKFSQIYHSDRPMDEWVDAWENYFNLGLGESEISKIEVNVINFADLVPHLLFIYKLDSFADIFESTLPRFKQKYWQNKKSVVKSEQLSVCFHLRQGDALDEAFQDMLTDKAKMLHTIKSIVSILDDQKIDFQLHLFSQGKECEFSMFKMVNINFHLDEDAVNSHRLMVDADILVATKGTYSYTAALLCEGTVIFEPPADQFWWKPLNHWILKSEDGSFDNTELIKRLEISNQHPDLSL